MGFGQYPYFDKKAVVRLAGDGFDLNKPEDILRLAQKWHGEGKLVFNKKKKLWEYTAPDKPYGIDRIANEIMNWQNAFANKLTFKESLKTKK
ncbi:hypothetical protein CCP1ISM_10880001 [Azospirillaceae bacterium]